jgi:Trk K+ transport system NAD-binding subunit
MRSFCVAAVLKIDGTSSFCLVSFEVKSADLFIASLSGVSELVSACLQQLTSKITVRVRQHDGQRIR